VKVRSYITVENIQERHTKRTLVAGKSTFGACTVVWVPANTTDIVFRHIPSPCCNGIPLFDGDFHLVDSKKS
jgi:hypothetical protein